MRAARLSVAVALAGIVSFVPFAVRAEQPSGSDVARKAKDAFTEGSTHFNLGQWDRAIAAWQRGYQLKPDPFFLYNIAQAYRLAENHEQAVFFYKSYLRNAPTAPNRAEVSERIAQLEAIIAEKRKARETQPDRPIEIGGTPRVDDGKGAFRTDGTPKDGDAGKGDAITVVRKQPKPWKVGRGDLSVAAGVNLWLLGVPGGAQPSAGIALSGGYTVLTRDRIELRVGGKLGYSYLRDIPSTEHFLSILGGVTARFRVWKERLWVFTELDVGAFVLTGLARGSVLLDPNTDPGSTLASVEIRPSVGLELRVTPLLGFFFAPSLLYSPLLHADFGESSLVRFDTSLGAIIRL